MTLLELIGGQLGVIGVPVGPGHEDVEEHVRDLLQLVRINSIPDRRDGREIQIALDGISDGDTTTGMATMRTRTWRLLHLKSHSKVIFPVPSNSFVEGDFVEEGDSDERR